jgi:ParB family chromosome partitioning protein
MAQKKPVKKRRALGRGLSALLGEDPNGKAPVTIKGTAEGKLASDVASRVFSEGKSEEDSKVPFDLIPLGQISTNPFQPRDHFDQEALEELADSIKVHGIIQPITLRKIAENNYQIISGERRFRASKLAGLSEVPAYIRTADDQQMLEMALIENIQRENLNAIEVSLSYQRLIAECGLKQEELGDRVGKKRTTVNNYLRLLKLPPDVQNGIVRNEISMGHAKAILSLENIDQQLAVYRRIVEEGLSVRKAEALAKAIQNLTGGQAKTEQSSDKSYTYEVKQIQNKLTSHFGTKVYLRTDDGKKGEIKIPFVSAEDLNRLLEIIDL